MILLRLLLNLSLLLLTPVAVAARHNRLLAPISVGVRSAAAAGRPQDVAAVSASSRAGIAMVPSRSSIRYKGDLLLPIARGGGRGGAAPADTADATTDSSTSTGTCRPRALKHLRWAYAATGVATTAAWSTMVYTTIRSNQPPGAMMPCWQHGVFARIGAMSAAGLIGGCFASLSVTASRAASWEDLGTNKSCRRHNLALVTTGVASSLWVRFAEQITKIPGTAQPLASHQVYSAAMQAKLIACYGSAAVLGAAVWARSLPEDVRCRPITWPRRVVDGVSRSLLSIGPSSIDDPVQVKYSLLTSSFLIFTAMQTVCNMPIAVIPSWTSRRLSRAFPIYTFLGAVTSLDLKEAAEDGRILLDDNYRALSKGVKSFGGLYLGARAGAMLLDPSFPKHFGMVNQVPGLAAAAIVMVALTLRSDKK